MPVYDPRPEPLIREDPLRLLKMLLLKMVTRNNARSAPHADSGRWEGKDSRPAKKSAPLQRSEALSSSNARGPVEHSEASIRARDTSLQHRQLTEQPVSSSSSLSSQGTSPDEYLRRQPARGGDGVPGHASHSRGDNLVIPSAIGLRGTQVSLR